MFNRIPNSVINFLEGLGFHLRDRALGVDMAVSTGVQAGLSNGFQLASLRPGAITSGGGHLVSLRPRS